MEKRKGEIEYKIWFMVMEKL